MVMALEHIARTGGSVENYLASSRRIFYSSDGDHEATAAGVQSYADTTPTFLLDVPSGTTAIPLLVSLTLDDATAPAAPVTVIIEKDNADRYASGGTSEPVYNDFDSTAANLCTLYSGPTANAGYGVNLMRLLLSNDVDGTAGSTSEVVWTPTHGLDYIEGPGAFAIYTWAATANPTWLWTIKWAEIPTNPRA